MNEELRDNIKDALDDIQSAGDFAAFCRPSHFVDPYLCVGEANKAIRLPLREENAQRTIAVRSLAPYGRGSETFVDKAVRNTWRSTLAKSECSMAIHSMKCCRPSFPLSEQPSDYHHMRS